MSHLARIITLRESLTGLGVGCALAQTEVVQEAFVRAVVSHHSRFHDSLEIGEEEEGTIFAMLDKWNSVSPIKARLILESARLRLRRIRQHLTNCGVVPSNDEFAISVDIERAVETEVIKSKYDPTELDTFKNLVDYLALEMRNGHE